MAAAHAPASSTSGAPRAGLTLAVVFFLYMLNYMDRNVMGAVTNPMKSALSLSDAEVGLLQTVFLLCVAGFALPAAFLLDRWSRVKGITVMALLWSAATAFTGFMSSFGGLVLARALVGIGEAGYSSGGTALISGAFPENKRGKALGIFNASIPLGAALGTVLGGSLAKKHGWSVPFLYFAIPGVLLAGLALLIPEQRSAAHEEQPAFFPTLKSLLRIPTLRLVYVAFAMNVFISSAILAFLAPYLGRLLHLDEEQAGKKAGLILVLALVGSPLGGWLGDRLAAMRPDGRAISCAVTSALAALALAGALLLGAAGFPLLIAWGILTVAYLAPGGAITQEVVQPHQRATAWGACVLSMYLLGGAYSPAIVGAASKAFNEDLGKALLFVPPAGLIASVLFMLAARSYAADKAAAAQTQQSMKMAA